MVARTGFLFLFFSLHAAEELKFNLVGEDLAKNIYQVQVLNQFNAAGECPIANIVYGATCGRHAFKNAIFGLLALEARRNNNKSDFEEFAKDLTELTPSSECLFKEINKKLDTFRKEQAKHYIEAGLPVPGEDPQLRPEEVQYILENIVDITMNCGLTLLSPEDFAFIYFPPQGVKNFLKGEYGKSLIAALKRIEQHHTVQQAILLLVPGHWITVIVNKINNNLEFLVFDSASGNRINDANVQELISLITNAKEVLDNLAKEEAELKVMRDELNMYEKLKENIYIQFNLPNIADAIRKIAEQKKFPDLKRRASFLLTKIYFKGGTGIKQDFNLAEHYAAIAYKNTDITAMLKRIKQEKLTFPENKNLKLFIEPDDPLEFSYQGLIAKYKQNSSNTKFAKKLLNILNEIAYTKEGYANKFAFIRQYLEDNDFSKDAVQQKISELNRNLKLFKEPEDSLDESYQGLIEKYKLAKQFNNLPGQFTVLNLLNEIAYTKEGYANKFAFIREYLESKNFSQKELESKINVT